MPLYLETHIVPGWGFNARAHHRNLDDAPLIQADRSLRISGRKTVSHFCWKCSGTP